MKKIMYILILVILLCLTSCEFEPPHEVEEVTKEYDYARGWVYTMMKLKGIRS